MTQFWKNFACSSWVWIRVIWGWNPEWGLICTCGLNCKKKQKKKTNKLLKWKSGDTLINRCKKPHKIGKEKGNLDENPLKNMKHEIDTILQFNIKL